MMTEPMALRTAMMALPIALKTVWIYGITSISIEARGVYYAMIANIRMILLHPSWAVLMHFTRACQREVVSPLEIVRGACPSSNVVD